MGRSTDIMTLIAERDNMEATARKLGLKATVVGYVIGISFGLLTVFVMQYVK